MSEESAAAKLVASVVKRLDVVPIGQDLFLGEGSTRGGPRLFGGLVAGQSVVAAARTVAAEFAIHSLHAYFLQPGDPALDIKFSVERIKEGRNFHARQVLARQGDRVIFSMQASFQRPQEGFAHQDPMPAAPLPETVSDRGSRFWGGFSPLEIRDCDDGNRETAARNGQRRVWMRPAAPLPADPVVHLAMLVFMSDMSFVATGIMPHKELRSQRHSGASLDHTMWFHRQVPFDDWVLFTMETPAAVGNRSLVTGAMYRRDGTRIASVAQEGLFRFA